MTLSIHEIDYTVTVEITEDYMAGPPLANIKQEFKRRLNQCFADGCADWSKPGNIAINSVSEARE